MSYRVTFFGDGTELPGWALNISRGGLRAVLEDRVDIGQEFDIQIGDEATRRRGQVVWVQDEPDGSIVGVSFYERLVEAPEGVDLDQSVDVAGPDLARQLGVTEEKLRELLDPGTPAPGDAPGGKDDGA